MKRENGAGTWKKRSDGLWEFRKCFGYKPDGTLNRPSFYGKTKKIARGKADKYEEALNEKPVIREEMTLNSWLDIWMETYKKGKVEKGTYDGYVYDIAPIKKHEIGEMSLNKILPVHVNALMNDNEQYSPSRLKKMKTHINNAFECAIENDLCERNPARGVKLPQKPPAKEKEFFNKNELDLIYKFADTDPFGHIIYTQILTGVRPGELRALLWSDFDFNECLVVIDKAYKRDGNLGTTKSRKARTLPLPPKLVEKLLSTKKESVYLTNTPGPLTKDSFEYSYDQFFKRLTAQHSEVRHLSPYGCRHTYGTMLKSKNVNLKDIQVLMGHANISTTGNTYVHAPIDDLRKAVNVL